MGGSGARGVLAVGRPGNGSPGSGSVGINESNGEGVVGPEAEGEVVRAGAVVRVGVPEVVEGKRAGGLELGVIPVGLERPVEASVARGVAAEVDDRGVFADLVVVERDPTGVVGVGGEESAAARRLDGARRAVELPSPVFPLEDSPRSESSLVMASCEILRYSRIRSAFFLGSDSLTALK